MIAALKNQQWSFFMSSTPQIKTDPKPLDRSIISSMEKVTLIYSTPGGKLPLPPQISKTSSIFVQGGQVKRNFLILSRI